MAKTRKTPVEQPTCGCVINIHCRLHPATESLREGVRQALDAALELREGGYAREYVMHCLNKLADDLRTRLAEAEE